MSSRSPVRVYCAAVFLAALAAFGASAHAADLGWIGVDPGRFGVLALGVLIGELLPITLPRRGSEEELTLSAAFSMALLVLGGLGPAILAQALASIVEDVRSHKPAWRVRFNVGQYTLSIIAAWLALRALPVPSHLGLGHPFRGGQLAAMLLAAIVFYLTNSGFVGIAVARYQGVSVRGYFRHDFTFSLVTGGAMLLIAPIVLASACYSVTIVLLCLAPVVAMHHSVSQSVHSVYQARHDPLTELPNRTAFQDALGNAIAEHRKAAVLLLDLDRFKEVNDTLGHRYGDLLLVEVAERMRVAVGRDAHIARLGGDEFALVGPGLDRSGALALARRVSAALDEPFTFDETFVDAPASVGIALFPEDGTEIETLLQRADVAMYHAKQAGIDIALYDESYDTNTPDRLALTAELRSAVAGEEVVVWYQPQLDLTTRSAHEFEALVRWEHPRLGRLLPAEFVTIAERANLMRPLTDRVIGLVLDQIVRWRELGLPTTVAVNITPQALVDRSFPRKLLEALRCRDLPPAALKLEVTESALLSDPQIAREVLGELDALGIRSSIDDFGTGYSSLSYLADLPVSEVKIDRSFVSRMGHRSRERIIVRSTLELAHNLGMRAVAEGVEDPTMVDELAGLGCDCVQGHAISRALPVSEATAWLLREATTPEPAAAESAPAIAAVGMAS